MTNRTGFRLSIIAALTLVIGALGMSSAQAAGGQCTGTLAQYQAAIQQIQVLSAKANAAADQNPIYLSDVAYYDSAMADAQRCLKTLSSMTTASR
jgi:hypothetical protein